MLEGLTPPKRERLCLVGEEASKLDKNDIQIFEAALLDPKWSNNALTKALNDRGFQVGVTVLNKHRAKSCSCYRN